MAGAGRLRLDGKGRWPSVERALRRALYPELICFDVDGTIVDAAMSGLATVSATLLHLTGRRWTTAKLVAALRERQWRGIGEMVAELCARCGRETPVAEVERVMDSFYFPGPEHPGFFTLERPLIGPGLLGRLERRCALAFVTMRSRRRLDAIRSLAGLPRGAIAVCEEDVVAAKPDPEGVRLALTLSGRSCAWMVGDREEDVAAAVAAGVLPIGVGPRRGKLEAAGAAYVLDDINDLESLLPEAPAGPPP